MEVSRRECSPTFRSAVALIGAGIGNRPFPSRPTTAVVQHISVRKRGQHLSAANLIGWCDGWRGALREGQTAPKMPSNGVTATISPRTIREFQYPKLSETALLAACSCLRSAVQGWNPEPGHPRKAKRSSLRHLAFSPNSRAEPFFQSSGHAW